MIKLDHVNWGMIGCGQVTENKSGPAFNKIANSNLIGVMCRNETKVSDYAKRHQIKKYFTNADQLINDAEINAIYIATPPNMHAEYAIKAMQAGKAVYVEKPMARKYQECLEMQQVRKSTQIPLFIAYYRRALPYFLKIKDILKSNCLGKIYEINTTLFKKPRNTDSDQINRPWRVKPDISGGGYFYDLASHQLDIFDLYFGQGTLQSSQVLNLAGLYDAEDTVAAEIAYGDTLLKGKWSFIVQAEEEYDRTIFKAEYGELAFSFFSQEAIELTLNGKIERWEIKAPEHIQMPMIELIVNELIGKGNAPSNLSAAIRTNKLMEDIVKPYYTIDKA